VATAIKAAAELPSKLATFDPADWGPVPGATLQACRCSGCVERWGPELPPDDSTTVGAARARWRAARLEFLRETLGPDHPVYRFEVLQKIQRMSTRTPYDDDGDCGGVVIVAPPGGPDAG
jgi:hypothetical protein